MIVAIRDDTHIFAICYVLCDVWHPGGINFGAEAQEVETIVVTVKNDSWCLVYKTYKVGENME